MFLDNFTVLESVGQWTHTTAAGTGVCNITVSTQFMKVESSGAYVEIDPLIGKSSKLDP